MKSTKLMTAYMQVMSIEYIHVHVTHDLQLSWTFLSRHFPSLYTLRMRIGVYTFASGR